MEKFSKKVHKFHTTAYAIFIYLFNNMADWFCFWKWKLYYKLALIIDIGATQAIQATILVIMHFSTGKMLQILGLRLIYWHHFKNNRSQFWQE